MMNLDAWPRWLAVIFVGGPLLLAAVSLAFNFYLSRRYLDAMLSALKNSPRLAIWAAGPGMRDADWFARFFMTSQITGMVICPGPCIRAGLLDPLEIQRFPPHLKRLLITKTVFNCIIVIWSIPMYVLLQLR